MTDAAVLALGQYPNGGITTDVPRGAHPVLFAADVLHSMSLLAPEWGIDFNLEAVAHDRVFHPS